MGNTHPISSQALFLASLLALGATLQAVPAPTTEPADIRQDIWPAPFNKILGNHPPAATQPAAAPAIDPKAVAEQHQKEMEEQWRKARRQQRSGLRDRWTNAEIVQTFKPDALVRLSVCDGLLCADAVDMGTIAASRVAVEGSKAVWTISSPNRRLFMAQGAPANTTYVNITRFDFEADEPDYWQTRIMVSGSSITIIAQNTYGHATLFQMPGSITVRISESREIGKPQDLVFEAKATSLKQLRSDNPQEFRKYVMPLLTKFAPTSLMEPGQADVYGAFLQIPADPKITREIESLAPSLDSDDPDQREAASAKLAQLGAPGVLAAIRFDDSNLSYEQKTRLRSFVAGYRRRAWVGPTVAINDISFLIDCLEYEDPTVRMAAKSALEKQVGHDIAFDASHLDAQTAKTADAIRKQLLAPPPPTPAATQPATQPAPQV